MTFTWIHGTSGSAKDVEGSVMWVRAEVRWERAGSPRTRDLWREAQGAGGFWRSLVSPPPAVSELGDPGAAAAGLRLHCGAASHRLLGPDAPQERQGVPAVHVCARRPQQWVCTAPSPHFPSSPGRSSYQHACNCVLWTSTCARVTLASSSPSLSISHAVFWCGNGNSGRKGVSF